MGLEGVTPDRFAARLKKHRTEKGYSQEDLAQLSGLSKATICKYEAGAMAKVKHAVALSRALGIAFNYLIGFIDDPYDIEVRELQEVWSQLPLPSRANLYQYGVFLLGQENKDEKA